jgi:glutamine synthetase
MLLPWRPQQGGVIRLLCDIRNPDGSPFIGDGRTYLKKAVERCSEMGYSCRIGTECEFYLFKTDENGFPTQTTHDNGGYFDIAPVDKGENIRREICLCLEEIGIQPETSHHEQGPGQNEIDFKYSDPITAADNFLIFKSVVKAIAARNGLFASFMPKPIAMKSGSGLHVNLSLLMNNRNIFEMTNPVQAKTAECFIAGILNRIIEITAFLDPITNSYERLGSFEAPKYVSWSHQNRSQLIRIPSATGEFSRMELRSPDPSLNPYLAFALILNAGLDGIEQQQTLPGPLNVNLFSAGRDVIDSIPRLPDSLGEAVEIAGKSEFVRRVLGDSLLEKYCSMKKAEEGDFQAANDRTEFYRQRYFEGI